MYWNDHSPPHFHAIYGEKEARFVIESGRPMDDALPLRAERFVQEWVELHRVELLANWEKAREGLPLDRIAPLP